MVNQATLETMRAILEEGAIGLGLTLAEIRARYPAKAVRRVQIAEAVRLFEDLDLVETVGDARVRWIGPIRDGARPLGVSWARAKRYSALTREERVRLAMELSEELALRAPPGEQARAARPRPPPGAA